MSTACRMILVFAAIALVATTACTTPTAEVTASPATIPPTASPSSAEPSATPAGTAAPTTPSLTAPATPIGRVTATPLGDLRGGRIYALKQYSVGAAGIIRELWSSTLEGASVTTLAVRFEGPQEGGLLSPPGIDLRHIFSPDGRRIVFMGPGSGLMTIDLSSGRTSSLGIQGAGPSWTRDGRWIVYAKADPAPADFWQPFRLWAVPADLSATPRQIPGDSVHALAGGSRVVAYDSSAGGGFIVVDAADGRRLGRFPDLVGAITWSSAASQFAYVLDHQQTPGGGRPDDTTSIVVAAEDLSSPRVVVQRTGSQYEVHFRALRWNPQRDELLYSVEGVGQTPGIVQVASGAERSLTPTAQYLTWAQDGERLVGLARGDAGPRPTGLPSSLDFKRATVVVLDRDGSITRRTEISALEPYESVYQLVTVGY